MGRSSTKGPGDIAPWVYKAEEDLSHLESYAVEVRYPGENATVEKSREAVKHMNRVRHILRTNLGLVNFLSES